MRILFLILNISVLVSVTNASCDRELLDNYSMDSKNHEVFDDQLAEFFEVKPRATSVSILKKLLRTMDCKDQALQVIKKIACHQMYPEKSQTNVCYAEISSGYFFITKDMMDKFNVLFVRFD